jgi:hypothetical protein
MSANGLDVFDKTLQTTHIWLDEIMAEIGPDRQVAWHVLGVVLRAVRDRIPLELAMHFGSQLPLLVRGTYYDQWHAAAWTKSPGRSTSSWRPSANGWPRSGPWMPARQSEPCSRSWHATWIRGRPRRSGMRFQARCRPSGPRPTRGWKWSGIVREEAMLRPAAVARESNPSFGPSDTRQAVAIVIAAAGFAAMGAAVVLRLKQLEAD